MDEQEDLAKDMLEQVRTFTGGKGAKPFPTVPREAETFGSRRNQDGGVGGEGF
jgi:hypothetical protein